MSKRILICYGTRYGSTAEVATEIAKTIESEGACVELVDLKSGRPSHSLNEYDLVVIGTGIQAGQWTKEAAKFLKENRHTLENIQTALFVVCGYAASPQKCTEAQTQYLDKVISEYPTIHIVKTGLFGGVFDLSKYNIAVKALIKRMLHQQLGHEPPERTDLRDWDKIREWALSLVTV